MKIEILYVTGCPTHPAAVALVRRVLADQGVFAEIHEILVKNEVMAKELGFRGSPAVRVNGRDVVEDLDKPEATALCCRVYLGSNGVGLPPVDAIRRAVVEAKERERPMKPGVGVSASVGAILSSVATLGCCLPFGFAAALGMGTAGVFSTTMRPWLLGFSVVLIGLGFWQRRRAKQCSVRGRWFGNVLLWTAVAVVLGMILFPQLIAAFIADKL